MCKTVFEWNILIGNAYIYFEISTLSFKLILFFTIQFSYSKSLSTSLRQLVEQVSCLQSSHF